MSRTIHFLPFVNGKQFFQIEKSSSSLSKCHNLHAGMSLIPEHYRPGLHCIAWREDYLGGHMESEYVGWYNALRLFSMFEKEYEGQNIRFRILPCARYDFDPSIMRPARWRDMLALRCVRKALLLQQKNSGWSAGHLANLEVAVIAQFLFAMLYDEHENKRYLGDCYISAKAMGFVVDLKTGMCPLVYFQRLVDVCSHANGKKYFSNRHEFFAALEGRRAENDNKSTV